MEPVWPRKTRDFHNLGNAVMGLIFGFLFLRWRRAAPMIVAHTLIDGVAFVGYALLVGHVSWLP